MLFLIARPDSYLEYYKGSSYYMGDVLEFYDDILPSVLDEMGYDYKILHMRDGNVIRQQPDSIYLSWHRYGNLPNIWHLKTAYVPNYFYFDCNGYGPWSEIVDECDYKVPVEPIRKEVEQFCADYIASNASRVTQPTAAYIPSKPYVLILEQRTDDAVAGKAHIGTADLVRYVEEAYADTGITVATRAHPLAGLTYATPTIFNATGNLHTALANALAVYTVNSGSGFEALLHGKRVFTTGTCDYHWAATPLQTVEEIRKSVELIDEPIDEDNRIQFLHYALNNHFVNIHDREAIKRKILRTINEYESRQHNSKS